MPNTSVEAQRAQRRRYRAAHLSEERARSLAYYYAHRERLNVLAAARRCRPDAPAEKTRVNRLPLNLIKRAWSNIIRRTTGNDPHTPRSKDLPVGFTDRDDFVTWTLAQPIFGWLYEQWQQHDYARRWVPSIDRISDFGGYTKENCQWIVFHENQSKPHPRQWKEHRDAGK